MRATWTRRELLKAGILGGAALSLGRRVARADDLPPSPRFRPFTEEMPRPPVLAPVAPFATACTFPPPAAQVPAAFYQLTMRPGVARILPGIDTEIWGYEGLYPGPTILAQTTVPVVVRQSNALPQEMSVHLHGGHPPSTSDGFPTDFIQPGGRKDYCYPNFPPGGRVEDAMTTAWYHDHAKDSTGEHVYRGLAGFYLVTDQIEQDLIAAGKLPAGRYDVPICLQDRRFRADGSLFFDPFQHDGFLGDVMVANGKAQPSFQVERRRYRFRFLNGANARFFGLRLSTGAPFLQVGKDTWLLPFAIPRSTILLGMAERADVIVDFRDAPSEVFLENVIPQQDGRGPGGTRERPQLQSPGVPLVKFVVSGPRVANDGALAPGDALRPHDPISPSEIVATRTFEFDRRNGAWTINGRHFDENRADATPRLGTAERWLLVNKSGGWWHPIHIHHEAHVVQRLNGAPPPPYEAFKSDTTVLGPNDSAEVFIRFRDFAGRFVFHCHNIEHEDMDMMSRFDVVP